MKNESEKSLECESTSAPEGGLTVIFQRKARLGKEREIEAWIDGISAAAMQFPGHKGQNVIRPVDPLNPEYVIVIRFDTYENLMNWHNSDTRAEWVAKVQDITEGEPRIRAVPGMSAWFNMPRTPPRWKTALVIFIVLVPLAIGIGAGIRYLFAGFHTYIQQIIALGVTVIVMTWFVMPFVNKRIKGWLYKGRTADLPGSRPLDM